VTFDTKRRPSALPLRWESIRPPRGRIDAGRRLRLADEAARPIHRQPGLGGGRQRRRQAHAGERDREPGPVLGAARAAAATSASSRSSSSSCIRSGRRSSPACLSFPFAQAKSVLDPVPELRRDDAREHECLGRSAQGAAFAVFLPENCTGKRWSSCPSSTPGDIEEGSGGSSRCADSRKLHGEHVDAMPYTSWQKASIRLLAPGARNYWKSHNFTQLADGALDTMIGFAGRLPSRSARSSSAVARRAGEPDGARRNGVRAARRDLRDERPCALGLGEG